MTSRAEIRPLADHVIDQIAAGEVVERPASIVKELLENSLDAGANRITIELDAGGIDRILVRDDGGGIAPEQLQYAVLRHYTSKLSAVEELAAIGSLGFRGEALASIAAVSEFAITSRSAGQPHGWRLELNGGQAAGKPQPVPHPVGTTVEVKRLFASIPARRHFLKRPRTELLHIQQLVRRAAFCYPAVALRLVHDGRQNLSLPPDAGSGAAARRWRALFGAEFCARRTRVDAHLEPFRVHGWVGETGFSRQNSDLQYIAVNGRIIRDRNVAHAVRMAYGDAIPAGRHAAYALHLELPRDAVDVNVHPGKAEVRFRDPRSVHDFVYSTVLHVVSPEPGRGEGPYPSREPRVQSGVAESATGPVISRRAPPSVSSPAGARETGVSLAAMAHNQFAIIVADDRLYALDLHAAIRRVVAGRLERGECGSRPLIIPETLAASCTDEQLARVRSPGVELDRFGDDKLVLRGLPVVVSEVDPAAFGRELVQLMQRETDARRAIAASAALAFRTPALLSERRVWFAALEHWLNDLKIERAEFTVEIEPATLSGLFSAVSR